AEYWLLERVTGTSDVSVTIGWDEKRNGGVSDISSLRVAHWNGTKWEDLGKGTTSGTSASGTIQTAAAVSNFSPFTLASTTALNALPIKISRFDAVKNLSSVSLNWTTENEINFSHFEVERAGRDNQFSRIGKVSAHNGFSMKYYRFEDHQPLNGVNLYRLKLIDLDGKFMYSAIVSVSLNDKSAINIYPNPASDFIQIDGLEVGVTIEINDASGRLVRRILSNASNRYSLSDLRKGMYFIKIIGIENTTVSKLIIQ
ncbi:MAG: T9SS type A sorting domain-containing protein, partial [Ginsengibacter sp.]